MIVLALVTLFVLFKLSTRVAATLRMHVGGGRRPTSKRPTSALDGTVTHLGEQVSAWTALDDLQLNRLLRDSAPH